MKTNFDKLLEDYKLLLMEADPLSPPLTNAPAPISGSPADNGASAQPQALPAQPTPKVKSSVGYAVLAQTVLDALKTPTVKYKEDIKFSDNKIRTPQEAYQYLEIIKRNLPPDSQQKLTGDMGKGAAVDLDSSELVFLVQLGLKALFYTRKSEEDTPFNDLISIVKVDTDNAKEIMEKIRNLLSNSVAD